MISIIVGMSKNRAIGKANDLLWYLPDDLRYFKAVTEGKAVIMGRKTFESILARLHKPLPNRTNIVVTHDADFTAEGAIVAHSIEEAIEKADSDDVFVIGGAQIYSLALPLTDRLYMTEVDVELDGDAFFPDLAPTHWKEVSREHHPKDDKHAYPFDFVIYDRIQ